MPSAVSNGSPLPVANGGTGNTTWPKVIVTEDASPQVVPTASSTLLALPTEVVDTDACYSAGLFTAPRTGYIFVSGAINTAAVTNNCSIILEIKRNGSTLVARVANLFAVASLQYGIPFGRLVNVTVGDTVGLYMYQNQGVDLTLEANEYSTITFHYVV